MRDLTFTHWASVTAKSGKPVTLTWARWTEVLTKHEVIESKEGVGLLTLCTILAGKPRQNKNVITVDGLCLDIDHGTRKQISAALRAFMAYEFVLHTTHSHGNPATVPGSITKEKPDGELALDEDGAPYPQTKIRVVFPLKRAIDKSEHRRLWRNFTALSLDMNDEQTKAVSHPFYLPAARPNPPEASFILHNKNEWLDPDAIMEATPEAVGELVDDVPDFKVQEQAAKGRGLFKRMEKTHDLRDAATLVNAGQVFAEKGKRHDTILKLTGYLAFKTHKRPYSPRAIDAIFRPSIVEMQKADPTCEGTDAAIEAYATGIEKAREHKKASLLEEQKQTTATGQDFKPWTREDVEAAAELQECEPGQLVYVVQRENGHFIINRSGKFTGPYTEKDVQVELFQALSASPVELYDSSGDGYKPRSLTDIVRQHGQIAAKVVGDLGAQETWYNRKHRTLYEAVVPLRRAELGSPAENPEIEEWLRLFCGPKPMHEKVLNWMACCGDLNRMLCALTLAGPPGSGKNLFAEGMASLWADSASGPECIIGTFNEDLARCPLVFADESLPKTIKWDSVTTKLRAEIGSLTRTLNRKYRAPTDLKGSLRFILATNNPMILASKISTAADLKAIAQRFLYVETSEAAEDYLKTIPTETKNKWRESGLARYALWLQEHRAVEPEGRFWVMGSVSRMHRLLVTSSNWNSWCCEWIVKGLLDSYRKSAHKTETANLVVIQSDKIYVNTQAISEGWSTYANYPNINPDPRHIATALRSISSIGKSVQIRQPIGDTGEQTRFRYFEIDTNHLVAWAEEHGMCAREDIEKHISQGTTAPPTVVNLDGTPHNTTN